LILRYSQPGGLVLDQFVGGCTTARDGRVIPLGMRLLNALENSFLIEEIVIKTQHNCASSHFWGKSAKPPFLRLAHDYLFILPEAQHLAEFESAIQEVLHHFRHDYLAFQPHRSLDAWRLQLGRYSQQQLLGPACYFDNATLLLTMVALTEADTCRMYFFPKLSVIRWTNSVPGKKHSTLSCAGSSPRWPIFFTLGRVTPKRPNY
jgi:hypothetical protein